MAKPKHGRFDNVIHTSSTHRIRSPSPAVLAALALIAASPTVPAAALPSRPPDFLCPFIQRDNTLLTSDPSPSPSTTPTVPPSHCTGVTDKYVQGTDSLWRKTGTWTLFGSTCGSRSTASTPATQSQPSSVQAAPSPDEFDTSVLPAGWDNSSTLGTGTEPNIVLALAIILAGSICVFMICCVIWRRRKKKARDTERKLGHRRGSHDDSHADGREKDARGKMRMWAKATARWRSNIRQSARRRKKRPASSINRSLSPTLADSTQLSVVAPSAPSHRGSIAPEEPDPSRTEAALDVNGDVTELPAVLHDPPCSPSPPTYGASLDPRFSRSHPRSAVPEPTSTPSPVVPYAVQCSNQPSIDDEPLPYTPPRDGHVATDDKSQLVHIQALASSPPITVDAASARAVQTVSAPEWHEIEDDLADFGVDLNKVPTSPYNFGLPPAFPPPPSKSDVPLPFVYLEDQLLRYEEEDAILASLPVPASSGPSFGGLPSAPPIDDPGLEPSAPSLEDEDELLQDWDEALSHVPEVHASADLASTPARATTTSSISPIPSIVSSVSRASSPPIPVSAARDGILPRYHP